MLALSLATGFLTGALGAAAAYSLSFAFPGIAAAYATAGLVGFVAGLAWMPWPEDRPDFQKQVEDDLMAMKEALNSPAPFDQKKEMIRRNATVENRLRRVPRPIILGPP